MSEENSSGAAKPVSGNMFLYRQPELLTVQDHGDLGLTPVAKPFEHVSKERVIPLTMTEFSSAQRHFPIIFSSTDEQAVPLAVVGIAEGENLFVGADYEWDPMVYLPSYLRCHPFAFAKVEEDRMAAVIDRAAPAVTTDPQFPFFKDGKPSAETEQMMEFCVRFETERNRTREFCALLAREGLITTQKATQKKPETDEEVTLAEYNTIDSEKLTKLADDTLLSLHKNGQLSSMYLQLYSIENWRHLMARRVQREMAERGNGKA